MKMEEEFAQMDDKVFMKLTKSWPKTFEDSYVLTKQEEECKWKDEKKPT